MQPAIWKPPIELSKQEAQVVDRIRRAKLFAFLRHSRHELFDEPFQQELATLYPHNARKSREEISGQDRMERAWPMLPSIAASSWQHARFLNSMPEAELFNFPESAVQMIPPRVSDRLSPSKRN